MRSRVVEESKADAIIPELALTGIRKNAKVCIRMEKEAFRWQIPHLSKQKSIPS
jgi:hypothetical protein